MSASSPLSIGRLEQDRAGNKLLSTTTGIRAARAQRKGDSQYSPEGSRYVLHLSTARTPEAEARFLIAVVLLNQPVFGYVRDKLGVVVRAFFAQRDFEDRTILVDFYDSIRAGLASLAGARSNLDHGTRTAGEHGVFSIGGESADPTLSMGTK